MTRGRTVATTDDVRRRMSLCVQSCWYPTVWDDRVRETPLISAPITSVPGTHEVDDTTIANRLLKGVVQEHWLAREGAT